MTDFWQYFPWPIYVLVRFTIFNQQIETTLMADILPTCFYVFIREKICFLFIVILDILFLGCI